MKVLLSLIFVFLLFQSHAACVTCYSIEEAMENPEGVRQLILRNKGLTAFPDEVLEMSGLVYLDLSFNKIVTFPDGEGKNLKLKHLNLTRNIGLNTHSLFSYTRGKEHLESLDLTDCSVGQLSYAIGQHPSLLELRLSGNQLATIPGELGQLRNLKTLNLSKNKIKSIPYVLSELYKLEELDLSENVIENHESIFLSLSSTKTLKKLVLSMEQSSNRMSAKIANLPITSLHIVGSTVSVIPAALFRLENLTKLVFEQCDFSNNLQQKMDWSSLNSLEELAFMSCPTLPNMSGLSNVTNVRVFGADALPPDSFCKMKKVSELNLSGQPINGTDLNQLKSCLPNTKIIHTSINDNRIAVSNRTPIKEVEKSTFVMQASSEKVISTDQMMMDIPQNAFTNEDGSIYTGEVILELKELFDPVSMLLEQVPMTYNNNGVEELFGSNGMFEFRAIDDKGNALQPNPNALIEVTLENQQPNNTGDLFYLNDKTNEWRMAESSNRLTTINVDSLRIAYLDSLMQLPDNFFLDIPNVPIYIYFKPSIKSFKPSELTFQASRPQRNLKVNKNVGVGAWQRATNYDQYFITRHKWKLDTTVQQDLAKYLRNVRKNQRNLSKRSLRKKRVFSSMPRPIKDLKITPDFDRDCFMMTFSYFDTTLTFPVYLASNDHSKDIAKEQKRFYDNYLKTKKKEERNKRKLLAEKKLAEKYYAKQERKSLALNLALSKVQIGSGFISNNSLSFSLSGFGVINCDYFSRNPVNEIIDLPDLLSDVQGRKLEAPEQITLLFLNTNSTFNHRPNNVPIHERDKTLIAFFSTDQTELHVAKIKDITAGIADLEINTIALEGLTSRQIRKQMMAFAQ